MPYNSANTANITLEDSLRQLISDEVQCAIPPPAETHELVVEAIRFSSTLSDPVKDVLEKAWCMQPLVAADVYGQDWVSDALATDRQLWENVETTFAAKVAGKYKTERLAPFVEWSPGHPICIQNWPTLSKNASNPDADLWDPSNSSHCAHYLRKEGMEAAKVCVFDWTPARFSNELTGKDPQAKLPDEFLNACDAWVYHRIRATIACNATVIIISSWCRNRFFSQHTRQNLQTYPLTVNLPITPSHSMPSDFYFLRCIGPNSIQYAGCGKVFFKASIATLTKKTPISKLAESVRF